jgi:hypothetical protein
MKTLLIPVTDPESGERAVRDLIAHPVAEETEVELDAVVSPLAPMPGRSYVTPQRAEDAARTIASTWLMRITPLLRAAGIPYRTRIVVGRPDVEVELAMHREDIDSVLLPDSAPRLPARHPVTVVH